MTAKTDAERRAAIETTPVRKLREMRMALELDKALSKPEILTRYLNLVSFGNGAFGVQDAARTYFGIDAWQLNWQQAALLAGMVQSTSTLNPYTNPEGALARRNLVLDTMIANLPDNADELRAAKAQPLGVLPRPNELPQGCIGAGDRAFFCDYALQYLARAGITREQVARNGYLIRTTLDPKVQASVKQAVDTVAKPTQDGVASVMTVIRPGRDAHRVVAMADNRTYGLDLGAGQTVQPQPFSLVGDGAGSIFKIFTTAAALDMGMGINAQLDVPQSSRARAWAAATPPGARPQTWCVKNAGSYRSPMSVTDALAQSPNTAFANLIRQVGVPRAVDMAVKLGLRSYAEPGTARAYDPNNDESLADYIKRQNIGSFTLGPFELNALELSNVAATLASGGMWCPPTPIDKVFDRKGREVAVPTQTCEQVVPEGLANTLANALGKDTIGGTAAGSAGSVGWNLPMSGKTGTTESHRSSGFLGFTNQYAAANYIFDDSPTPSGLCSYPLRKCSDGNLFGGNEPARTWFLAMKPIARRLRSGGSATHRPALRDGGQGSEVPSVTGLKLDAARKRLQTPVSRSPNHPRRSTAISRRGPCRNHAEGPDHPRFDRHDQHQQRDRAGAGVTTLPAAVRPTLLPRPSPPRLPRSTSSTSPGCRRSPCRWVRRHHRHRHHRHLPRDRLRPPKHRHRRPSRLRTAASPVHRAARPAKTHGMAGAAGRGSSFTGIGYPRYRPARGASGLTGEATVPEESEVRQ